MGVRAAPGVIFCWYCAHGSDTLRRHKLYPKQAPDAVRCPICWKRWDARTGEWEENRQPRITLTLGDLDRAGHLRDFFAAKGWTPETDYGMDWAGPAGFGWRRAVMGDYAYGRVTPETPGMSEELRRYVDWIPRLLAETQVTIPLDLAEEWEAV